MPQLTRRALLAIVSTTLLWAKNARATLVKGELPWSPGKADPPVRVTPGPWKYFTAEEGAAIEALVDRLIPPDPETPGGKDAGCAVFIDRQMAGPYGRAADLYMNGPFQHGTRQQGHQSSTTPAQQYRAGLAALDKYCRTSAGKPFVALEDARKDEIITGLEKGSLKLEGADGHAFFEQLIKDTQQGFFADPIYGGNRDMAAWKMIGFPGARYDYREFVERHNERFPLPPIGIGDHPDWGR